MEYGLLSLLAPVWELVVDNSSTTLPNTTTADHTTSARATPTTFPDSTTTTTPPLPAEARAGAAPAATYADKTVLLARAIEDGTADRSVFYVTLCLCLLQLLVVLGMRFTRSCACKSTQDGSATSLLNDDVTDVVKPATVEETKTLRHTEETKTLRTAREKRESSRRR